MKYKYIYVIICALVLTCHAFSQSSFEVVFEANGHVRPTDGFQDANGDFIIIINAFDNMPNLSHPYILKLNTFGEILISFKIDLKDYLYLNSIIHIEEENKYLVFGTFTSYPENVIDSILIMEFSQEFELIEVFELPGPFLNEIIILTDIKRNANDQFILTGFKYFPINFGFIYVLNSDLLLMNQVVFDNQYGTMFHSIEEFISDDLSGYLITFSGTPPGHTTNGEFVLKTNYDLEIIEYYSSHIISGWGMTNLTKLSDTIFIKTGKYYRYIPPNNAERDVAVEIIDHNNILIASSVFGKSKDTIDFPGVFSGAAVVDANNIFVPGTSNFNIAQYPYATTPSWLMLNKVDGDLNLQWQKFYGGDAHYVLYGIIPSSDGGCVMLGTRFHPDNPTGIDGYILKVGPDGLVSVPEVPGGLQVKEVIVFPNPGSTHLNIQTGHENLEIRFYSSAGSLHHFEKINRFNHTITTTSWPAGVYIYQIYKNESLLDNGKWIKAE
jgi:hypothetical protein